MLLSTNVAIAGRLCGPGLALRVAIRRVRRKAPHRPGGIGDQDVNWAADSVEALDHSVHLLKERGLVHLCTFLIHFAAEWHSLRAGP
ncbi:hypothetical protein SAMN04487914_13815 [Arthrobacter sp. ok909]|nr:hypothetical protein SAMN04487914_13815 [Arthrobacter sp. ok909]